MLSIIMQCRDLFTVMLTVVMLLEFSAAQDTQHNDTQNNI
jgi:hypothetical protein